MSTLLDLTRVLDEHLPIYTSGSYSDPPLQIDPWCTVPQQGYAVSRLTLGTQTGTHIDAPAHFIADGATLDALPLQALMGRYLWADLSHLDLNELRSAQRGESILFLASSSHAEAEI